MPNGDPWDLLLHLTLKSHMGYGDNFLYTKHSEYDQEIPQSQTADKCKAPRGRATQQSRDTRKTN